MKEREHKSSARNLYRPKREYMPEFEDEFEGSHDDIISNIVNNLNKDVLKGKNYGERPDRYREG